MGLRMRGGNWIRKEGGRQSEIGRALDWCFGLVYRDGELVGRCLIPFLYICLGVGLVNIEMLK